MQMMEEDSKSDDVPSTNYVPPSYKTVDDILSQDKGDESLEKYKATLLGAAPTQVIVEPNNPKIVILKNIALAVPGRPDMVMDLSNLDNLHSETFKLKEGTQYRLKFDFYVQREIVTGLKYIHKVYRMGAQVASETLMVGSYAPKAEIQTYISPIEEAPSGMLHRATYKIKSKLTDDDGNDWLTWKWALEIAKDW